MSDNILAAAVDNGSFEMETMTAYINHIDVEPPKFATLIEWEEKGINTVAAAVEEKNGRLRILQSSPRGSEAQAAGGTKRKVRHFEVPHFVEQDAVHASEVQGVRQFGSTDALETVEVKRNEKLEAMRKNHELTAEYGRAGAVRGVLYDADGEVLQDWHDPSGFNTPRTESVIDITDPTLDLRVALIQAKRKSEVHLGGYMVRGFKLMFSPEMFDAFIAHPSLKTMYERYLEGAMLRNDPRKGFKVTDNIEVFSYEPNTLNGVEFIPNDTGFLVPDAPGLFKGRYAPADTLETANTIGLAFYAFTTDVTKRAIKMESESNALFFCESPSAIGNIKWS
ncbi:major capsid protein [Neorhizobium tomejilense]|uniref:major capsid protein n=1 Tax=Neorhizobium tomejilense TaxID=2093828 RepID=UPI003ECC5DAB